ncbi:MAG: hypothetical protein KDI09_16975 [Halioglobus sp.]|nr:hypothetical protein [Halioglobus sp.]
MTENIQCYRCGASLESLTLPLSRQDQCPDCSRYLHVCRMCLHFDRSVARQCREDDAEEVMDKEKANFCDWFVPAAGCFTAKDADPAARAGRELAALFGDGERTADAGDAAGRAAEDLFRK